MRIGRIPYVNCYPVYGAIDRGCIDLVFERHQCATYQHKVLVTLGVIIVEELIEKLATVVGSRFVHQVVFSKAPTTSAS